MLSFARLLPSLPAIAIFALGGVSAWAADDSGIYPPGVAPDAAFVRVVDVSGAAGAQAQVDNLPVPVGANATTPYQVITPGQHVVGLGSQSADLTAEASSAYTIALDASGTLTAIISKDLMADDPAKATIALYNYTDQPITLTALAKEVPVFEAVAPGTAGQRQMNPVSVDLKVKAGTVVVEEFPAFAMQPRSLVSFFVFQSNGSLVVKSDVARGDR